MIRDIEVLTIAKQLEGMAGLPEVVAGARDAVVNLNGPIRRANVDDPEAAARLAALDRIVRQAAKGSVEVDDIDLSGLYEARRSSLWWTSSSARDTGVHGLWVLLVMSTPR